MGSSLTTGPLLLRGTFEGRGAVSMGGVSGAGLEHLRFLAWREEAGESNEMEGDESKGEIELPRPLTTASII